MTSDATNIDLVDEERGSENYRLEVRRMTRSGRVFNNDPDRAADTQKRRVQNEMSRLGTTWFNPLPEAVMDDDIPNVSLGREVEEQMNDIQKASLNAMDHLFREEEEQINEI